MSSFLQKARDRAHEAAAQFSGGGSSQHDASNSSASGGSPGTGATSGGSTPTGVSNTTYTGSLPHVFRQGLANFDPRFESTRSLHVMRGALKGVVIDEAALSRETKSAAAKTFKWGLDHRSDERMDGVGDPVLVDVSDRLAFVLSTLGDLEQEHSQRLSQARATLKQIQTAELDLAAKRAQRVKVAKELHDLTAQRVKPQGSDRATQQSAYLHQLQGDAKDEEEALSAVKRRALRESFEAQFDSYIQHGEKLALVASYGKLLAQQIPTDGHAEFPAPKGNASSWPGAGKTAEIRSLIQPALQAYQPRTPLPVLSGGGGGVAGDVGGPVSPAASSTSTMATAPASFASSHAHELAQDEARTNAPFGAASPDAAAIASGVAPGAAGFGTGAGGDGAPLSPLPEGGHHAHNPNLNHSPSALPSLPARPAPAPLGNDESALSTGSEDADSAPPGPTVAETGAILASSPDGPGPKSGTLQPRRRSSAAASGAPKPPPRPVSTSTTTTASGPIGNTAPAVIPAPATPNVAAAAKSSVNARIRRDGTITRRGQDKDFEQAEEEQLPAYED